MSLFFDHTRDLDLEVSRSKYEIALAQDLEGWLAWNKNDVSQSLCDHGGVGGCTG